MYGSQHMVSMAMFVMECYIVYISLPIYQTNERRHHTHTQNREQKNGKSFIRTIAQNIWHCSHCQFLHIYGSSFRVLFQLPLRRRLRRRHCRLRCCRCFSSSVISDLSTQKLALLKNHVKTELCRQVGCKI